MTIKTRTGVDDIEEEDDDAAITMVMEEEDGIATAPDTSSVEKNKKGIGKEEEMEMEMDDEDEAVLASISSQMMLQRKQPPPFLPPPPPLPPPHLSSSMESTTSSSAAVLGSSSPNNTTTELKMKKLKKKLLLLQKSAEAWNIDEPLTALRDIQFTKLALRTGKFRFDDKSIGDFTYVPEGFDLESEKGFTMILTALGIYDTTNHGNNNNNHQHQHHYPNRPELVFEFPKNHSVVPNMNKEETIEYQRLKSKHSPHCKWHCRDDLKYPNPNQDYEYIRVQESRVLNFLDGLSDACSQTSALFILPEPFTGNRFAELACISASTFGIATLGLFDRNSFSKVDETTTDENGCGGDESTSRTKLDYEVKGGGDTDDTDDDDPEYYDTVPWSRATRWDPKRRLIVQESFEKSTVTQGDQIIYAIEISCNRTEYEEEYYKKFRYHHIACGLANKCSHRLVFANSGAKHEFHQQFMRRFPTGGLIVGIGNSELDVMADCLKKSRPLFILEHTGLASNAAAILTGYGEWLAQNGKHLSEEKRWEKIQQLLPPKDIYPPLPHASDAWHPGMKNQKGPPEHGIPLADQLATDTLWEDSRAIALTFASYAPHFNPNSYGIFDMSQALDVDKMQEDISLVMSAAFDFEPELGGGIKDRDVQQRARSLIISLRNAKVRYENEANVLAIITRGVIFLVVLLTAIQGQLDREDNVDQYEALKMTNIILPLVASGLLGLDAIFRPSYKFSALLLAEKRIEGEIYRFRTRTGEYRPTNIGAKTFSQKTRSRTIFTRRCQEIFQECQMSDMSHGSLENLFIKSMEPDAIWTPRASANNQRQRMAQREKQLKRRHNKYDPNRDHDDNIVVDEDEGEEEEEGEVENGTTTTFTTTMNRVIGNMAKNDLFQDVWDIKDDPLDAIVDSTSIIAAEEYLEFRVKPMLKDLLHSTPALSSALKWLQVTIVGLTAASTAFVSFELEFWVPVVIAGTAYFEFFKTYLLLESRVPNMNAAATELTKVLFWWDGLTTIQSRVPSCRDQLVDRTEDAILARYEQYAGLTVAVAKKRYDEANNNSNNNNNEVATSPSSALP